MLAQDEIGRTALRVGGSMLLVFFVMLGSMWVIHQLDNSTSKPDEYAVAMKWLARQADQRERYAQVVERQRRIFAPPAPVQAPYYPQILAAEADYP